MSYIFHPIIYFTYRSLVTNLLCVMLVVVLCACGKVEEPVQLQESTSNDTSTDSTTDTSMSNNHADEEFTFEQFIQKTVVIDMATTASQLEGDYYVIKLYDNEQTYYLGVQMNLSLIELPISVPLHVSKILLEIFTNQPQSGFVKEEVVL